MKVDFKNITLIFTFILNCEKSIQKVVVLSDLSLKKGFETINPATVYSVTVYTPRLFTLA